MNGNKDKNADLATVPARQDHEPPSAIAVEGWRYHHIGIPTQTPRPGEIHVQHLRAVSR
jgi:hypothetical protein